MGFERFIAPCAKADPAFLQLLHKLPVDHLDQRLERTEDLGPPSLVFVKSQPDSLNIRINNHAQKVVPSRNRVGERLWVVPQIVFCDVGVRPSTRATRVRPG